MKKIIIIILLVSFAYCPLTKAIKKNNWQTVFSGYGYTKINNQRIILKPKVSTSEDETHAGLVIGPELKYPLQYELTVKTTKHLRQNTNPNPWEVGWVIWHYTDNDHFYYFAPKPNGWSLGKRDPAYDGGQRFLATGSHKKFPINEEYQIKIIQRYKLIKVYVSGKKIVQFKDTERPYKKGHIGVYSEDAKVKFTNIKHQTLKKKS